MAWPADKIDNWKEMRDWIDARTGSRHIFLFRGQPAEYDNLKPKLLRLICKAGIRRNYEAVNNLEKQLGDDFVRQAPLRLDEPAVRNLSFMRVSEVLQCWAVMQHHGAPTRLLDWTGSPYVALYFAVVGEPEQPGEVWCYAQADLETWWRRARDQRRLNCWPVEMGGEAYQRPWTVDGMPILHHFILTLQTSRMAAQQGVFTVCTDVFRDHAELLEQILQGNGGYYRAVIPPGQKVNFLKQLRFMNITGASLFPDIDGVGRLVDEKARIELGAVREPTGEKVSE